MADEQQVQINLEQPIAFALSNVMANHSEDGFNLFMVSGAVARLYFLSPKLAKKFFLVLQKEVEAFEKQWGEIQTQLPRPQVSSTSQTPIGFDMNRVASTLSASASPTGPSSSPSPSPSPSPSASF